MLRIVFKVGVLLFIISLFLSVSNVMASSVNMNLSPNNSAGNEFDTNPRTLETNNNSNNLQSTNQTVSNNDGSLTLENILSIIIIVIGIILILLGIAIIIRCK